MKEIINNVFQYAINNKITFKFATVSTFFRTFHGQCDLSKQRYYLVWSWDTNNPLYHVKRSTDFINEYGVVEVKGYIVCTIDLKTLLNKDSIASLKSNSVYLSNLPIDEAILYFEFDEDVLID